MFCGFVENFQSLLTNEIFLTFANQKLVCCAQSALSEENFSDVSTKTVTLYAFNEWFLTCNCVKDRHDKSIVF